MSCLKGSLNFWNNSFFYRPHGSLSFIVATRTKVKKKTILCLIEMALTKILCELLITMIINVFEKWNGAHSRTQSEKYLLFHRSESCINIHSERGTETGTIKSRPKTFPNHYLLFLFLFGNAVRGQRLKLNK